jgi:hypothetical protein
MTNFLIRHKYFDYFKDYNLPNNGQAYVIAFVRISLKHINYYNIHQKTLWGNSSPVPR